MKIGLPRRRASELITAKVQVTLVVRPFDVVEDPMVAGELPR